MTKKKLNPKYPGIPSILTGRTATRGWGEERFQQIKTDSDPVPQAIGFSMAGGRVGLFLSSQEILGAHCSLYAAVGKHLPLVLNMGCGAVLRTSAGGYASHDAYHAVGEAGCFQFFAKDVQQALDFSIVAHRIAELSLIPGIVAQDEILTTETSESVSLPEPECLREYLGVPEDRIDSPTPSQRLTFGEKRRRIPELWTVDQPLMSGTVQNPDFYASSVAAGRPFYSDSFVSIMESALEAYGHQTGRFYRRVETYRTEEARYLIVAEGSVVKEAEAVADYLREKKKIRVGVVQINLFRPFPVDCLSPLLRDREGILVLERCDQPMSENPPLLRELTPLVGTSTLYSAIFGMGGAPLRPGDLIAAVENMLPEGKRKRRFYLSIPFIRPEKGTPVQEVQQQAILESYSDLPNLSIACHKDPEDWIPGRSIVVRFVSLQGGLLLKVGRQIVHSLSSLLNRHVQGSPNFVSSSAGRLVGYDVVISSEPIRMSENSSTVDLLFSIDTAILREPHLFNALRKKGAFFVVRGTAGIPETLTSVPFRFREEIFDRQIEVLGIDVDKISKEETAGSSSEETFLSEILLGALFPSLKLLKLTREEEKQWTPLLKEGLVQRGFSGRQIIDVGTSQEDPLKEGDRAGIPVALKRLPKDPVPMADIHRFWAQTESVYARGGGIHPADPFLATGILPARTGLLRDLSSARQKHPRWLPEKCTGCGECWMVCPDSAIPPSVHEMSEISEAVIHRLEEEGGSLKHLPRAVRSMDGKLRTWIDRGIDKKTEKFLFEEHLAKAISETVASSRVSENEKGELEAEFSRFCEAMQGIQLSITQTFYKEKQGGILSLRIDPDRCKGCLECVRECPEQALEPQLETPETLHLLRKRWEQASILQSTSGKFVESDETLFLSSKAYYSMVGGDEAPPGSSEKTALHLFSGAVTALMEKRVENYVEQLNDLIDRLDKHIRLRLSVKVVDPSALDRFMDPAAHPRDLTLAELSESLDREKSPVDMEWLQRVTRWLSQLKHLKWLYTEGESRTGRSALGVIQSRGSRSDWTSRYPYNPFSFPWTSNLDEENPAVALGIFEKYIEKRMEEFKVVRKTQLELEGKYNPKEQDPFFERWSWKDFNEEEFALCPPVVLVGSSSTLYGSGLRSLSSLLQWGVPVKVVVLDKLQMPASLSLLGFIHSNVYVLQSSLGDRRHLLKGLLEGMAHPGPAVFNLFCSQLPQEGVVTDQAVEQARVALRSQLYPHFSYHPGRGNSLAEHFELQGDLGKPQDNYSLNYINDRGEKASQEIRLTYADFVVLDGAVSDPLVPVPPKTPEKLWVSVAEFLSMDKEDQGNVRPFVYRVDHRGHLKRYLVSEEWIRRSLERKSFIDLLRTLKRLDVVLPDEKGIEERVRSEVIDQVTKALVELAQGNGEFPSELGKTLGIA